MPSLATTQPNYPRRLDLRDSVDPVDRQLESCYASTSLALGAICGVRNPTMGTPLPTAGSGGSVNTGADSQSGKYFMPNTIAEADRTTYETQVNAVVTALKAAQTAFATIQALKPVPNQG